MPNGSSQHETYLNFLCFPGVEKTASSPYSASREALCFALTCSAAFIASSDAWSAACIFSSPEGKPTLSLGFCEPNSHSRVLNIPSKA